MHGAGLTLCAMAPAWRGRLSKSVCPCCGRASYCEIYNEALYDLLHWTKEQLQVRWDAGRGFHVPNLAVKDCPSVDDMLNVSAPESLLLARGLTREQTHQSSQGACFLHVRSADTVSLPALLTYHNTLQGKGRNN